jgi:hypothetical protein
VGTFLLLTGFAMRRSVDSLPLAALPLLLLARP